MSTSTETQLTCVNKLLTAISEPEVSTTSETTSSKKAKEYLRQALLEVSTVLDWSWLTTTITGTSLSWSSEKGTLLGVRTLHWIKYKSTNGDFVEIPSVKLEDFYVQALTSYDTIDSTYPERYSWTDDTVRFNPYPSTSDTRNQLHFCVTNNFTQPILDSINIAMPDRFVNAALQKALANLALIHEHDQDKSQLHERNYQVVIQRLMSQERSIDHRVINLYGY